MPKIQLDSHQIKAIKEMHNGCILHGGVGSGKSRTALAYYYTQFGGRINTDKYVRMVCPRDLYVITTAKKRDTLEWEEEMVPFLLSTNPHLNGYSNKVVVDSWNNIGKYENVHNAFFIFDEQRVVGKGSWVKSFLKIAKWNQWILLSATPGDTWSDYIPVFIANGFYDNRTQFNERHVIWKSWVKFPQVDRYIDTLRLIRLRDRILVEMPMERHTTQIHERIFTEFDRQKYREIIKTRWNPWLNKPIETPGEFCQSLRRVVNEAESRQQAVLELFEKHGKVIIFYNFDYEREILLNLGYGPDVEIAEWSGHAHQEVPTSESWVYLVQYNAGSEGWNCVRTNTIIFYSENYSYKMMEQASGRIDRMNTRFFNLYYYHLTSTSSIEIAIRRALMAKKQFNEQRFSAKFTSNIVRGMTAS